MGKLKGFASLFGVLLVAALIWRAGGVAQQVLDFQFLDAVARIKGLPVGILEIGDRVTLSYPTTGVTLQAAKVVDRGTGEVFLIALDSSGRPVDPNTAADAESRARVQKYGNIDPALYAEMTRLLPPGSGTEVKIPVAIWVKTAADRRVARPLDPTAGSADEAHRAQLEALQREMAARRQALLDELQRLGVAGLAPRYSPVVFATLSAGQIQTVARHPDVAVIYGQRRYRVFTDDAGTTLRSHRVWASGNLGSGVAARPAIHEPDGVADWNPYLNNDTHPVIYWCSYASPNCPYGKNVEDGHATMVAGTISSTHPLYRGMAPNAQVILSANTQDWSNDRLVEAAEWAIGNGAGVINMSWGTVCGYGSQDFTSWWVDWATRVLWQTFTIAAGNQLSECSDDRYVAAPGLAWSVITVGAHYDLNNGFWSGDGMSSWSQYRNPSTGQEKPEVAAVGQDVRTTDHLYGDHLTPGGVSGTSFAAPLVAGVVTQMLYRQPGQRIWPETNKAAILASAWHDIVAGTDRDGVGAPVATAADDTYKNRRYINDRVNGPADFASSCAPLPGTNCRRYDNKFYASAGTPVRVALAWTSWSTGTSDQLGADIDLYVIGPNNTTVAGQSLSIANAWELVEFTAPTSGYYDIVIKLYSYVTGWPGTYLGIAWSSRNSTTLPNFCAGEITRTVSASGSQTASLNTAAGGTYFDGYSGWGYDQSGRTRLIKLNLTTTKDITISDTNANLDLHLVQLTGAGCSGDPVTYTALGHSPNGPLFFDNLAPGTYYILIDGAQGYVGSTTVTIVASGP